MFCSELRWIQALLLRLEFVWLQFESIIAITEVGEIAIGSGVLDYNPLTRKLALHHGDAPLPHRHPSGGPAKKREEEE